jgi:hypothetical protein
VLTLASAAGFIVHAAAATKGPACTKDGATRIVSSFFSDFNRGDLTALRRDFAPGDGRFQWYSVGGLVSRRLQFETQSKSELLAYFARRHAKRDHYRLLALQWNGDNGHGNITFTLRRTADDASPGRYYGKAGFLCGSLPQPIFQWIMTRTDPACTSLGAAESFAAFMRAVNQGNRGLMRVQLSVRAGVTPGFSIVDHPGGRKTVLRTQVAVLRYFATRHQHGDRYKLANVRYNGRRGVRYPGGRGELGTLSFTIRRISRDLRHGVYRGKASFVCAFAPARFTSLTMTPS